jgi:hypothetical protein
MGVLVAIGILVVLGLIGAVFSGGTHTNWVEG